MAASPDSELAAVAFEELGAAALAMRDVLREEPPIVEKVRALAVLLGVRGAAAAGFGQLWLAAADRLPARTPP